MLKRNAFYNCDCMSLFERLSDNSVDLVLTDPPYDLSFSEKEMYQTQFLRVCKGTIIVFAPPENQWVQPADQYLFWTKPISTKNTSRRYSRFVEMIFVYGNKVWNCERHWSNYVNIFNDRVDDTSVSLQRKPPSLINRLLFNHSKKGDVILDPFAGSGTILEMAKMNGRKYIGCELDKKLFKVVERKLKGIK